MYLLGYEAQISDNFKICISQLRHTNKLAQNIQKTILSCYHNLKSFRVNPNIGINSLCWTVCVKKKKLLKPKVKFNFTRNKGEVGYSFKQWGQMMLVSTHSQLIFIWLLIGQLSVLLLRSATHWTLTGTRREHWLTNFCDSFHRE